ncbi:MAG: ATP-binding cassette domain-containing protein [Gemmatimonadales bacterium]
MTDKPDDPGKPADDRRFSTPGSPPGGPAGPGVPIRRASDEERVRDAIRKEILSDKLPDALPTQEWRAAAANKVVQLEHVFLAFENPILQDVSFEALAGETIVVAGESGTGKSTILKLLLRLLVPDKGEVYIDGDEITQLKFADALKVRQKMGMVFQGAALFDSLTVFENIAYPLREHTTLDEAQIEERVREKLDFVDLDPDRVMEQLPSDLSGGMRKRVGIARGMANNPKIMLYDEPTSGLDPLTTATITHLIIKLQRELGVTSIVVTHDIRSAFRMASKIAVLYDRKICFFGTPEEMSGSNDKYLHDFLGGF